MPVQCVIFDFDGVLADSEPLHLAVRREVCAALTGGEVFPAHAGIIGGSTESEYARMLDMYHLTGSVEKLAAEHYVRTAEKVVATYPRPDAQASELLDALDARHIPFGVCSSSPHSYLDTILSAWGLAGRFAFLVGGSDAPAVKPAPDLYLAAIAACGFSKERALAIEDSRNGVCAAKAAGLRCLGFLPAPTGQDLSAADAVLPSMREILAWIDRDNRGA